MFFSGDYEVKKTRAAYVISVVGEENSVRITEKEVDAVLVDEEPEMIAILLGLIEFARINEKAGNFSYPITLSIYIDKMWKKI